MRWQWTSRSTARNRKAAAHPRTGSGVGVAWPLASTAPASTSPSATERSRRGSSDVGSAVVSAREASFVSLVAKAGSGPRVGRRVRDALQRRQRRAHVAADRREDESADRDDEAADDRPLDGLETVVVAHEALDRVHHDWDLLG